jgi:hypothetical protein
MKAFQTTFTIFVCVAVSLALTERELISWLVVVANDLDEDIVRGLAGFARF